MEIRSLGYIGIGAPDPKEWLKYGTEIIGMMPARAVPGESWGAPKNPSEIASESGGTGIAADGSVYLKMDDWQWRVGVHPNEENKGIMYLGLEVRGQQELEEAVRELQKEGFEASMGSEAEALARGVTALAKTRDPAGNALELFYGPTMDRKFVSPFYGTSFKAGKLGFGHLNLFVSDMQSNLDFYTRVMGMRLSDYISFGPDTSVQFTHCNARHHSIALVRVGDFNGLHHVLFEMETTDAVGQALDRVQKAKVPITSSLGRHSNDNMFSFYMSSPFGFDVEIGAEGAIIDDSWVAREFCEGDIWGHNGLTAESISEAAEKIK
jgi:2,3-dihydroxybiphenyl 1,2-dioxygenase